MKKFLLNLLGNTDRVGVYGFSLKKQLLLISSIIVWTVPLILLWKDRITGLEYLGYLAVTGLGAMAMYVQGKKVDNGHGSTEGKEAE